MLGLIWIPTVWQLWLYSWKKKKKKKKKDEKKRKKTMQNNSSSKEILKDQIIDMI